MVSRRFAWSLTFALVLASSAARAADGATIRETIEVTRIDSPSLSPNCRFALWREYRASIDRNGYDVTWMIAPVDGSTAPRRLADAGEMQWLNGSPLPNRPVWTSDSQGILFRKLDHGEIQIWRAEADGSQVRALTNEAGNIRDIIAIDGARQFLVTVGPARSHVTQAEQADYDSGTLIDASVDPQRPLYQGDWIDGRWASSRLRGFWFEQGGILPAQSLALRILDPLEDTLRDATDEEKARYAPPAKGFDKIGDWFVSDREPSGDARGIAVTLEKGKQTVLAIMAADGHEKARCAQPACVGASIRSIRWLGLANAVLFEVRGGDGRSVLSRWNVADGTVHLVVSGDGMLNGNDNGQGCAASAKDLLCVAAAANAPPRVVTIDMGTGEQRVLAKPNIGLGTSEPSFAPLAWTDDKGRMFTGFIAMPEHTLGLVPLFINYYSCGGYLRGGLGEEIPLRAIADAGIAALCINRYSADPGVGGNLEAYSIAADGIAAIIDRLAREGKVDRSRVGMGGVSFGGEVAAWIAIHTHLLRAISVANVMVSPTYYWLNAVKGRDVTQMLEKGWGLGDPDVDHKGWRLVSPAMNVDRISIPFLMQVPEHEYRPNVEILARLQAVGKPVELWAFPGEMHIKWQPRHQLAANTRNLDWFRFWLTGETDPDPAKAAQYERWRRFGWTSIALAEK